MATNIFPLYQNIFKRPLSRGRKMSGLCGKGFSHCYTKYGFKINWWLALKIALRTPSFFRVRRLYLALKYIYIKKEDLNKQLLWTSSRFMKFLFYHNCTQGSQNILIEHFSIPSHSRFSRVTLFPHPFFCNVHYLNILSSFYAPVSKDQGAYCFTVVRPSVLPY